MKMYAAYIAEREEKLVLQKDWGFATYKIKQDYIYVEDMYIKPEYRKSHKGSNLVAKLCQIAIDKGLNQLMTTVDLRANNPEVGLKAALSYGFKPYSCEQDIIQLVKYIKEI